jgi:hypothetical protein
MVQALFRIRAGAQALTLVDPDGCRTALADDMRDLAHYGVAPGCAIHVGDNGP